MKLSHIALWSVFEINPLNENNKVSCLRKLSPHTSIPDPQGSKAEKAKMSLDTNERAKVYLSLVPPLPGFVVDH